MAINKKTLNDLPEAAAVNTSDIVHVVQGTSDKKVTLAVLKQGIASSADVLSSTVTVAGSAQSDISTSASAVNGSGTQLTQTSGLPAGTKSLQDLLQSLVSMSHGHSTRTIGSTGATYCSHCSHCSYCDVWHCTHCTYCTYCTASNCSYNCSYNCNCNCGSS